MKQTNEAAFIVARYRSRQMLAGLGYRFDPRELTDFDLDCFTLIEGEIEKHREKALRKGSKRRG